MAAGAEFSAGCRISRCWPTTFVPSAATSYDAVIDRPRASVPAPGEQMAAARCNTAALSRFGARPNIRSLSTIRSIGLAIALAGLALLATSVSRAADIYDAAVAHAGRTPEDLKRDPLDHPAEILRLAGIKSGMRVGDFMASDGYYSELLSYIVGPKGHVLLINDPSFDRWSNNAWEGRIAHNRLPNVEHKTVDLNHMQLADGSLDAVLVVKVYHDLYWVDTDNKEGW